MSFAWCGGGSQGVVKHQPVSQFLVNNVHVGEQQILVVVDEALLAVILAFGENDGSSFIGEVALKS